MSNNKPDEAEKLRRVLGRMVCCKHCMGNELNAKNMLDERNKILDARRYTELRQAEHGSVMLQRNKLMAQLVSLKEMKASPEVTAKIQDTEDELTSIETRYQIGEEFARSKRLPAEASKEEEYHIPVVIEWTKDWLHEPGVKGSQWKTLFHEAYNKA